MTKEEMILKKLFVALDDRSLNLKRIGQHLERLPRSYALESLEEAMESYTLFIEQQQQREEEFALFAEQQQQRQEETEQREEREREAKIERKAPSTMRDLWSDVCWFFNILIYAGPILLVLSPFLFIAGLIIAVLVQGWLEV